MTSRWSMKARILIAPQKYAPPAGRIAEGANLTKLEYKWSGTRIPAYVRMNLQRLDG